MGQNIFEFVEYINKYIDYLYRNICDVVTFVKTGMKNYLSSSRFPKRKIKVI